MKFKYRKTMLIGCFAMMFIGMITMTVGKSDNSDTDEKFKKELNRAKTQELQKDEYPKINDLIEKYLKAEVNGDLDELSLYVNDIDKYSYGELNKKLAYVEYFDNVSCYTIDGYEEDSYVVYVYREYKLKNIDTLIPSVVLNYVCKNSSGEYVVYTGEVSKETNDFISATEENPSVLDLIDMVNSKIESIKKKDDDVKDLMEQLDLVVVNVESGDYETPQNAKKNE